MANPVKISVVIPNFNGRRVIEPAVKSALEQADEVLVVDDGSTDGAPGWIRGRFPAVRVEELRENRGFAAACNVGARLAAGDILYFLNSDAELLPGALEALRPSFEDPRAFAAASLEERGWWPVARLDGGRLALRYIRTPLSGRVAVISASGGHAAFHREMFLGLGGFDEGYAPFYWEDIDLCWRAWLKGWSVRLEPRSRVRHGGGETIARVVGGMRRRFIADRNARRFSERHLGMERQRMEARTLLARIQEGQPAGVMYLSEVAHLGGAEQSLLGMASGMDRARWCPLVVSGELGPLLQKLERAGVETMKERLPRLGDPREWRAAVGTILRLARLARERGARIVHGNSTRANLYAWCVGRLIGARVVWHARNLAYGRTFRDLERWVWWLPDVILANSHAVAERFRGKARVVYNGVDTERFHPRVSGGTFRETIGVGPAVPLVGLVGRIGIGKGHEPFLRAASLVLKEIPEARVVIVGSALTAEESPLEERLHALVRELGLTDRVIFAGWRENLPEVYAALDVVVSATEAEPFGRVLAEAMVCGRPVVAFRSGGVPEVVGEAGVLVKPGDSGALATAVSGLLLDPRKREALGRASREWAEVLFSVGRMVRGVTQVYDGLAGSGNIWRAWCGAVVVAGLALAAGWGLTRNYFMRDDWGWLAVASRPALVARAHTFPVMRPAVISTFAANWRLGGLDPSGYYAVQMGLHALNAFLLWKIARALGLGTWSAFAAGMLAAVWWPGREAVVNLYGRPELLAATGGLLGILAILSWVETPSRGRLAVAGAACLLAAASHESGLAAAPACLLAARLRQGRMSPAPAVLMAGLVAAWGTAHLLFHRGDAVIQKLYGIGWHVVRNLDSLAGSLFLPVGSSSTIATVGITVMGVGAGIFVLGGKADRFAVGWAGLWLLPACGFREGLGSRYLYAASFGVALAAALALERVVAFAASRRAGALVAGGLVAAVCSLGFWGYRASVRRADERSGFSRGIAADLLAINPPEGARVVVLEDEYHGPLQGMRIGRMVDLLVGPGRTVSFMDPSASKAVRRRPDEVVLTFTEGHLRPW